MSLEPSNFVKFLCAFGTFSWAVNHGWTITSSTSNTVVLTKPYTGQDPKEEKLFEVTILIDPTLADFSRRHTEALNTIQVEAGISAKQFADEIAAYIPNVNIPY